MNDVLQSHIEIDGFLIEGDSKLIMGYVLAVENALENIGNDWGADVWVGSDGFATRDDDDSLLTVRVTQSVRLTASSKINYRIVEDEYSRSHFADGALGNAGKQFLEEHLDSEEGGTK